MKFLRRKLEITSPYGMRNHPCNHESKMHYGIDCRAQYEDLICPQGGIIIYAANTSSSCGRLIKIQHEDNTQTVYCHLSKIKVQKGDEVKAGMVIGQTGNSGRTTGPHLHFGRKIYSVDNKRYEFIDPEPYARLQWITNKIPGLNKATSTTQFLVAGGIGIATLVTAILIGRFA